MIKYFFNKYQKELVKLANLKSGREFLDIEKKISPDKKIVGLTPNTVIYQISRKKFGYLCHAGQPFARKLVACISKTDIAGLNKYQGLLHYTGLFEQPRLFPQIFLATYQVETHTDAKYSIDKTDANWATARGATSGTVYGVTNRIHAYAAFNGGTTYEIIRGFFSVDTSAVSGTIEDASLYAYFVSKSDTGYSTLLEGTQAATNVLEDNDFDNFNTTKLVSDVDHSGITLSQFTEISLNSDGISAINTSGYSKFCWRNEDKDYDNVAPTQADESYLYFSSSDVAGEEPYLDITVTTEDEIIGYFYH